MRPVSLSGRLPRGLSHRAALVALACALTPPSARASRSTDAAGPGPFAIGFTYFVELDPRGDPLDPRHGELDAFVFRRHQDGQSPRPVPMMVFYPVDTARPPAPPDGAVAAAYPANPFRGREPSFSAASFPGTDTAWERAPGVPLPVAAGGPFPLAVLLAGGRAPYFFNIGLATRLAGHGFVVALLAHYGDAAYATSAPSDPVTLLSADDTVLQRLLNRVYDVQLAIDVLLRRAATPRDLFEGRIDPARVAAGGHSLGGLAALHVVGGDDDLCDDLPGALTSAPCRAGTAVPVAPRFDPRVRALVLYEPSVQALHWHELRRVDVPALLVGRDAASLEAEGSPRLIGGWAHQALGGHPSYLASVEKTSHLPSFTSACATAIVRRDPRDIGCGAPPETRTPYQVANELVWRYAVAFARVELAGDGAYQALLTPGWAITSEPLATFYVNERRNGLEPPPPLGDPEADRLLESFVHTTQPDVSLQDHPAVLDE